MNFLNYDILKYDMKVLKVFSIFLIIANDII